MTVTNLPPMDNVVRALYEPQAVELRAASDDDDGGGPGTLFGHFAVFNRWTEIDSLWEGRFLERIAPGAFTDTLRADGASIRVLYDHGSDPSIGNKPLGAPRSLTEDKTGAAYEVDLFDADYVRELVPALEAGQLGASFRFQVRAHEWVDEPEPSDSNPHGLPERTITDALVREFGPVTFPAYADATAGVRSLTDDFHERLMTDPTFVARFTERVGLQVAERVLAEQPPSDGRDSGTPQPSPDGQASPPAANTGHSLAAALAQSAAMRRR